MSDTLSQAAGVPVSAEGLEWKPLTMLDFGAIQEKLPIPPELKPFASLPDLLQFTRTPIGVSIVWPMIAPDGIDAACYSLLEKIKIIQNVTNYSLGVSPKRQAEDAKEASEKKTDAL